jgi:hypothetical protein
MRFGGLIAVLSIPFLSGFVPILTYGAAVEAARAACGKLVGKNIRTDLYWFGSGPGPSAKPTGVHWQLTARRQGDDASGPNHWYFKVDIPPSGAGPNKCFVNGTLPGSELVMPGPPAPKPRPLVPKHNA